MNLEGIYKIDELLLKELCEQGEKCNANTLANCLPLLSELARTAKNVEKLILSAEQLHGNYSGRMSHDGAGNYLGTYSGTGTSHDGYDPYINGRGHMSAREAMNGYSGRADGGYSASRGYSRDASSLIRQLEDMMHSAPDEQTRRGFQELVDKMRR